MTLHHTTKQTDIPSLPEGYTTRMATVEDAAAAAEIVNRHRQHIDGDTHAGENAANVLSEWETPGFDLTQSVRVVENVAGQMVAFAELWDDTSPPVQMYGWTRVPPSENRAVLERYLLDWMERRARESMPRCPEEARVSLWLMASAKDDLPIVLWPQHGYNLQRRSWRMLIELDAAPAEPSLPDGITIRPYAGQHEFEQLVIATEEAFTDHFGFVKQPHEEALAQWRHWTETDPEHDFADWFLAVDDASGEIAGMSLCRRKAWEDPTRAYIATLGVRRPWRKRGLGLALLQHSFGHFYAKGQPRIGLHVDAGSLTGATRLYEKAGMHVDRQHLRYEKVLRHGVNIATTEVNE